MNTYTTAKITKIIKENYFTNTYVLDARIKAIPGQFVIVWLPQINEKPFSLTETNPVTLTVAKVGPFTKLLHKLKINDTISFRGPYGKGFKKKKGRLLMIGGGYGVVPLYCLCKTYSYRQNITVIIGAKTKKDLLFIKRFKKLKVDLKTTTDNGSKGFKGTSCELTEKLLKENKYNGIYTCGPLPMIDKIASLAYEKKISCQLSLENIIKCGVGLCSSCVCGNLRVCKDGPVISASIYYQNVVKFRK
jgi:dihydroorotate dehydrogenase electron transfer subunit